MIFLRIQNTKTSWSYAHWSDIELLSNELIVAAHEMSERIGSGGDSVSPDELINSALRAEAILARIKVVAHNYN